MTPGLTNYQKVKEKVDSGEVRLIGIISPPRVVSTALEIALAESPSVDGQINEPFHLSVDNKHDLSAGAEERAYADILRRIEEVQAHTGKKNVTLVMKEMAKNIAPGEQFERWLAVTDKHVVQVRNPLTSLESLIRKVCDLVEKRPDLAPFDVNAFALKSGCEDPSGMGKHWQRMVDRAIEEQDYTPLNDVLEPFFPSSNLYRFDEVMQRAYLELASDRMAQAAGFKSLNHFAAGHGHKDWAAMKQAETNLEPYEPILDRAFAHSNAGWESLGDHMRQMGDYVTVESTVMRAEPERTLRELSDYLGIEFDPHMISGWSHANGAHFDRGHSKSGSSPFIYKAVNSTGLNKPQESPIAPERFPEFLQGYIVQEAIPTYVRTLSNARRIGPTGEHNVEAMLSQEVSPGVTLEQRDPVFAYTIIATDPDMPDERKQDRLALIRQEHISEFAEIFRAVDHAVFGQKRHLPDAKPWMQPRTSTSHLPTVG